MIIAGTVPIESLDLVEGEVESLGNRIRVADREIPLNGNHRAGRRGGSDLGVLGRT